MAFSFSQCQHTLVIKRVLKDNYRFKSNAVKLMRPFLKWAGNKYSLISTLLQHLPEGRRLIEPFAGSAALTFNSEFSHYVLADSNSDLINLFHWVQKGKARFINECAKLFTPYNNQEEIYYAFRQEFNELRKSKRKAALFLYLNRHGYNGLCRYNRTGGFNVPFGRFDKPFFPEESMHFFHTQSPHISLCHQDFTHTIKEALPGDVIYCDPPYAPLSQQTNFTTYTGTQFNAKQHHLLAQLAREKAAQGIPVVISNHDTPFTRECYEGADIVSFKVRRTISQDTKNRKLVKELLAIFS